MPHPQESLSPGQLALGSILVALPRRPADAGNDVHEAQVMQRFRGVPDDVLMLVAEEIELGACPPGIAGFFARIKPQPSLVQIERMVQAAPQIAARFRDLGVN